MGIAIGFGNERRSVLMLDLNNVTLNSILAVNTSDNMEAEPLSVVNEQREQDDDNSLDPNTFVLLYAEIVATILAPEKNTPAVETADPAPLLEPKPLNTDVSAQEHQAINTLDDNVAVAWINSEYYQSEQEQGNTLNDVEEPAAFKLNNGASEQGSYISAQQIPDSMELLKDPVPLNTMLEQKGLDVQSIVPQLSDQVAPSVTDESINIKPQLHQDTLNHVQIPEPLTDEASFTAQNEALLMQQSESMAHNTFLRSVAEDSKQQDNFILKNNVSSDDELPAEEPILLEDSDFIQFKTDFMAEAQTDASVDVAVMQNEQPKIDSSMFQQIANNTANSVLMKQDKAETATAADMPQSLTIPTDIEDTQWSKHFSDQVVWLGQQGMKNAVIKLHPEDLGPLEISIKVVNDSASVTIVSHSQQVRDMIDQTLPRLQEMMAEQGLNLAEVNVDSEKDERRFEQGNNHSPEQLTLDVDDEPMSAPIKHKAASQGIIDYFA